MPKRQVISAESSPAAIGPYSQAVRVGNLVFCSGQIPLDPVSMQLVEGNIETQTKQIFANMEAVAEAAGATLSDICKLTIYLTNIGDFATVNELMANHFTQPYPARATVEVSALPKGAHIEIEAIIALPEAD
ncbi:MAG: RidA family protein [Pseudohongiellaceae bacterium]|nr:RidA family protein [Pseudohongiellaceae bacterium]